MISNIRSSYIILSRHNIRQLFKSILANPQHIIKKFKNPEMDYNISLQQQKDAYSPQTQTPNYNSYTSDQYQNQRIKNTISSEPQIKQSQPQNIEYLNNQQKPTGITKFCQLKFYEQYFRVSQLDVTERIKLSFVPIKNVFIENLGSNPDFYGPFWILTTIIFLLSSTGNLSRYFYNWEKDAYIFKLQLVRYGVTVMYSFGLGFPTVLYFLLKFLGSTRLSLPELICLYGYSFSCFIPIFLLCIIPAQPLQWILIAYGTINTTVFLIFNIKQYLQSIEQPKVYVIFGIIIGVQLALFLTFKLVFFKMVYEVVPEAV